MATGAVSRCLARTASVGDDRHGGAPVPGSGTPGVISIAAVLEPARPKRLAAAESA
ncbi:hypothetical protein LX16_5062 [Stackebrandtia albiflava]|uniref:Uncharacterized protein n=1 Tax=Stackebrandtia albiflava TaxID=406432 RepID=A0A562UPQ6_9ACTN|nr:hypothetical protein LX16_5062 [Stackebrandtia albiflava]